MEQSKPQQLLSVISEVVTKEEFDPYPLFNKFCRIGYSPDDIAEAIYDGFTNAYTRWDTQKYGRKTFGYFCTLLCRGQINKIIKYRNHYNSEVEICDDLLAEETVRNNACMLSEELLHVNVSKVVVRILRLVFTNYETSKCAQVLFRRYVLGETWEKVAEYMGFNSRQAAQNYNHRGMRALKKFANTKDGKLSLLRLLTEEGAVIDALDLDPNSLGSTFFQDVLALV